jgi:proprotein convertase subtilisin/kexin type 5
MRFGFSLGKFGVTLVLIECIIGCSALMTTQPLVQHGGNFIKDGIKICKCTSDEKCHYCSDESKALGLCESCNTESGYYKKKDDDSNQLPFINCYKDKPLNHYLNTLNEQFEPCHENCMSCEEGPTETQDNCEECKSGYSFIKNNIGITNCYQDCTKKYYFDSSNNFHCVDECPSNYKLITNTNKCIDNCMHDNIYNSTYELDGVCYKECPSTAHILDEGNRICEADLTCNDDEYFNYERTECISDIPTGFYCDDENLRTIAQCHTKCKRCNRGPTENNNNCIECKETKYFYLGNCLDTCTHGNYEDDLMLKCTCEENIECKECTEQSNSLQLCKSCNIQKGYYPKSDEEERDDGFIKCYKNPEKYFLDNEKYYPCYETCLSCDELGDETNNKCTSCLPTHLKKHDFEDDDNCYEICVHYYYYYSDKKHYCTDEDQCPPNYKLISAKRKCIDDCTKDDNDKFEYNGNCVSSCPPNTHINDDNPNKCIDNLNCELTGKYYNYERTACIDDIPEGFIVIIL